jgi:predicted nucleotidyltransferase
VTGIFRPNRDRTLKKLNSWAQKLADDPRVVAVILFGSFARGGCTAASDADLLVLLQDSESV